MKVKSFFKVRAFFIVIFFLLLISPFSFSLQVNSIDLVYVQDENAKIETVRPATPTDAYIIFNISLDENESLVNLKAITSSFSDDNFFRKEFVEAQTCNVLNNNTCIVKLPIKIVLLNSNEQSSISIEMPFEIETNLTTYSNSYTFQLLFDTTRPKLREILSNNTVDVGYTIHVLGPGQNIIKVDLDDSIGSFNLRQVYLNSGGRQYRASKCEGNLCYFSIAGNCINTFRRLPFSLSPYSKDDAGNLVVLSPINYKFYCDGEKPQIVEISEPKPEEGNFFLQGKTFSFYVVVKDLSNLPLTFYVDLSSVGGSQQSEGSCSLIDDEEHLYNCTFTGTLLEPSMEAVTLNFEILDVAKNKVENSIVIPKILASEESGFFSDVWQTRGSASIYPSRVSDEVLTRNLRGFFLTLTLTPKGSSEWAIWQIDPSSFKCNLRSSNEDLANNVVVTLNDYFANNNQALLFLEITANLENNFEANLNFDCSLEVYSANYDEGVYLTYPEEVNFSFTLDVYDGIFSSVERAQEEYDDFIKRVRNDNSLKGALAIYSGIELARTLCGVISLGIETSRLSLTSTQFSLASIPEPTSKAGAVAADLGERNLGKVEKLLENFYTRACPYLTCEKSLMPDIDIAWLNDENKDFYLGDPYSNIVAAISQGCLPGVASVISKSVVVEKCSEIACYQTSIESGVPPSVCKDASSKARMEYWFYAFFGGGNLLDSIIQGAGKVLKDPASFILSLLIEGACYGLPPGDLSTAVCKIPKHLENIAKVSNWAKSIPEVIKKLGNDYTQLKSVVSGDEGIANVCGASLSSIQSYRSTVDELYLLGQVGKDANRDLFWEVEVPDESVVGKYYPTNIDQFLKDKNWVWDSRNNRLIIFEENPLDLNTRQFRYTTAIEAKTLKDKFPDINFEEITLGKLFNGNSDYWRRTFPQLNDVERNSLANKVALDWLMKRRLVRESSDAYYLDLTSKDFSILPPDLIGILESSGCVPLPQQNGVIVFRNQQNVAAATVAADCKLKKKAIKEIEEKFHETVEKRAKEENLRDTFKNFIRDTWRTFSFIDSSLFFISERGGFSGLSALFMKGNSLGDAAKFLERGLAGNIYDIFAEEYFETPETSQVAVVTPLTSENQAGYYFIYGIKTPIYEASGSRVSGKFRYFIVAQTSKNLNPSKNDLNYRICLADSSNNCKKILKSGSIPYGNTLVEGNAFNSPVFNDVLEEDFSKVCIEFGDDPTLYLGVESGEDNLPKKLCSRLVS